MKEEPMPEKSPSDLSNLLTREAMKLSGNPSASVSRLIELAIRIARLRRDYVNLFWLLMEVNDMAQEESFVRVPKECDPYFSPEEYREYCVKNHQLYLKEREVFLHDENGVLQDEPKVLMRSVSEIELSQAHLSRTLSEMHLPVTRPILYKDQVDAKLRSICRSRALTNDAVLARIRTRVINYLSEVETEIAYSDVQSDVFNRYRSYVDSHLLNKLPEAYKKFEIARKDVNKDDPEYYSHVLLSCRRILRSVADALYPPTDEPVTGADGKQRVLGGGQFIARLWQYVFETAGKHRSGQLLLEQVNDLGRRLDKVYNLSNKGVHDEVSATEVDQCIIQTYIALGDILRISDIPDLGGR